MFLPGMVAVTTDGIQQITKIKSIAPSKIFSKEDLVSSKRNISNEMENELCYKNVINAK